MGTGIDRTPGRGIALEDIILSTKNNGSRTGERLADRYRAGLVLLTPEITIGPDPFPDGSSIGSVAAIVDGPEGGFYVVDIRENNIRDFDACGRFIRVIGGPGIGPGRFSTPSDAALSGDKLLVNDLGNRRLDVLGLDGSPIADVPWPGPLEHPVKLHGLPDGRIIMESEKIFLDDPTGPQDVAIRLLGPGFVPDLDIHRARVRRNTYVRPPSGGLANVPQPYHPELFWDVSPRGTIVIGSSEGYVLDILDPDKGKVGTISRDWDPLEVTADDRKMWFGSLVQVGGRRNRNGRTGLHCPGHGVPGPQTRLRRGPVRCRREHSRPPRHKR